MSKIQYSIATIYRVHQNAGAKLRIILQIIVHLSENMQIVIKIKRGLTVSA